MENVCPVQNFQKVNLLKETPNISATDFELLLRLEKLLQSEYYSNALNDVVSTSLDEMSDEILKKSHILELTALLNNLSNESRIEYVPNLETKTISLSQLIKIISENNDEEEKCRKSAETKEKFKQVMNVIFKIIAFCFIIFIAVEFVIPLVIEVLAWLWDLVLKIIYYSILIIILLVCGAIGGGRR